MKFDEWGQGGLPNRAPADSGHHIHRYVASARILITFTESKAWFPLPKSASFFSQIFLIPRSFKPDAIN